MHQHLQWWQDLVLWHSDQSSMILVTVVRADGSTPREVGATMLLRFDLQQKWQQSDTIGGGHLEFQAIEIAQAMLIGREQRTGFVERFNLSARLGQCCGGVMWLLFEKYSPLLKIRYPMNFNLQRVIKRGKQGNLFCAIFQLMRLLRGR